MATNTKLITQGARDFLATGPLAHVVTIGRDGTPQVSLAWAGFEGEELVFATFFGEQRKIENLRRDPRVVVSFQAREFDGDGLWPYLVVEGRARIEEGGALGVMDDLSEFYIGPGQKYPRRNMPEGLTIRVTVDRLYGRGSWREQPGS